MNHAHNDWAEWASEGGIGFALMLVVLAVGGAVYARWNWWGIGVSGLFLHALVDFPMQKPALAILTFFLLGCLVAQYSEQRRSPPPPNC